MKKTILGGLAGGFVLFLWGFLAWMLLPFHDASMRPLPSDEQIVAALQAGVPEKGVYVYPAAPRSESEELLEEWKTKYQRGPRATVVFDPAGGDPMMTAEMFRGLVINLLTGLLAAWLVSRSTAVTSTYLARVAYCGMLGIFISLATHFMAWNWMNYPSDYTTAMVADTIIEWILAGLAIAAVVKSSPSPQPAS